MKKGQATIEFIFTTGMMVFIFIVILIVIFNRSIELNKISTETKQRDDCLRLANVITYSFLTGNNYTLRLKYPVYINPSQRALTINNKTTCAIPLSAINSGFFGSKVTVEKQGEYINVK